MMIFDFCAMKGGSDTIQHYIHFVLLSPSTPSFYYLIIYFRKKHIRYVDTTVYWCCNDFIQTSGGFRGKPYGLDSSHKTRRDDTSSGRGSCVRRLTHMVSMEIF